MIRTALLAISLVPLASFAQSPERISLRGAEVAIYNIAGKVTIDRGSGRDVTVEVTRGGNDARRLKVEQRTIDGRESLCIVYPDERIVYHQRGQWGDSESSTSDRDCRTDGGSRISRITVGSSGRGIEAWADLRITIPNGADVRVKQMVGDVDVSGVDAKLNVDVSSASVTSHDTRGTFLLGSGSGAISVSGHRGDLAVGVGSGGVRLDRVDGRSVKLSAGSGSIHGDGVTTDDMMVKEGSGSVNVANLDARSVMIRTGSGGARIGLTREADDVTIRTGSGTVELTLPSNYGARVDFSTGSGRLSSDFPIDVRSSRDHRNDVHGTIGSGRGHIMVETGSGGLRIRRGDRAR